MGEHWANPKNLQQPIYGTYRGQVVFSEIMVPKTEFEKGFNYLNLRPLPGHTIDHVDIEYEPHGHEGMPIAHYDVHAYYVAHAAHMGYSRLHNAHRFIGEKHAQRAEYSSRPRRARSVHPLWRAGNAREARRRAL